ncbi:MAG: nitrogenase iron protein, partial [Acetivibrio sp.]
TSGESMSIYAAANLALAVENFKDRGYASLSGIILNSRGVEREEEKVMEFAKEIKTPILGILSRNPIVQKAEDMDKTVLSAFPESEMAKEYEALAAVISKWKK